MGFLKRFFSMGSKKNKKKRNEQPLFDPNLHRERRRREEQEQEAVASRLLRSSSAHFAVVSEVDYSSLPPIPHPINTVSSRTTTTSPIRAPSIQSKNSYVVTVHGRMTHSYTEFPNAYPTTPDRDRNDFLEPPRRKSMPDPRKIPVTPRDVNRLNRLRQDPSVVSLLSMYDDHGRLDDNAFSNTPPPHESHLRQSSDGRPQRERRQSTFRELLGEDNGVGDISWAERVLGEHNQSSSSISTTSSLGVQTPAAAHFDADVLSANNVAQNVTFLSDNSVNSSSMMNYPIISSMEVELSTVIDSDDLPEPNSGLKSPNNITRTPSQRASQVFNFLSEKRKGKPQERRLPSLPSKSSSASSTEYGSLMPDSGVVLKPLAALNFNAPDTPLSARELAALDLPPPPPSPAVVPHPLRPPPLRSKARSTSAADMLNEAPHVRVSSMSTAPHDVASSYLANPTSEQLNATRGPRGPRPPPSSSTNFIDPNLAEANGAQKGRRALGELTNADNGRVATRKNGVGGLDDDRYLVAPVKSTTWASTSGFVSKVKSAAPQIRDPFTKIPTRNVHRHTSSKSSDKLLANRVYGAAVKFGDEESAFENGAKDGVSEPSEVTDVRRMLPMTPVRVRALHHGNYAPSPASSSELSPETKQLMTDLRTQRMRARERDAQAQKKYKGSRLGL